ncbi:hypothetical protein DICPUDRAFT_91185 [Dictyostelium purpureum]|uniref:Uncharacterized protein n=1 Tax=Dictyostelium purpureum TaxID=5786 RepID=F0Z8R0_DICPU|nr:uncharacterized protein DICPUDRAFT_91185 [Dictyostelium purpureum]EGC39703.1 hypothetical protein DICPUDRAFT_91185 [Dictyostelium purpureum]|eukprot:XP_003283812.1 hypothetical protein DICPUDRAFT_91185 [Dictyostelium purpureum]
MNRVKGLFYFFFIVLFISNYVECFNYQEIQYNNNMCEGAFVFNIKTTQCSNHGYIKKVNETIVMVIPIKSSEECVETNDGSPKPVTSPSPTPSENNSTNSSNSHNSTSSDLSSNSLDSNSTIDSNSTETHNSNNTSSDNGSTTNEPYEPPKYYKLNQCNVLPDGTSVFVSLQEESEEHPYKEMNYCNDIELLDNNCDYAKVRTYNNFTCISTGKNEKGVAQFERISCRANLQSIDYDYCLHDCSNVNCNYNYTKTSGVVLCADIETIDTTNNANSIYNNSYILFIVLILINFILFY